MNRLWIRISLIITIIVLFGMLLPIAVGIAIREFSDPPPAPLENIIEVHWDELTSEERQEILAERGGRSFPGKRVLQNLSPYLIGVTLVSISVGVLLSRSISAPLSQLAAAARSIGEHNLSQRVDVHGSQEVLEVAKAFNEMAADLQNAETLRQNLLADVAHELRTPLSVIQGNLQAILDDDYKLDKSEIARLYDQTRQISRLVDELHELVQAEAQQLRLNLSEFQIANLVDAVAKNYAPLMESAGIKFKPGLWLVCPPFKGIAPV